MAHYKLAHLSRRGATLSFRMALSKPLAGRLGVRELKFALRTCDSALGNSVTGQYGSKFTSTLLAKEIAKIVYETDLIGFPAPAAGSPFYGLEFHFLDAIF